MPIARLQKYIDQNDLFIKVCIRTKSFDDLSPVEFEIGRRSPHIHFTVFDEYGDARQENQKLCLALLQMEFAVLQDAEDSLAWMRSQSIDANESVGETLYLDNLKAMRDFFERYGAIPAVVNPLDWQLNSGAAQLVRHCQ